MSTETPADQSNCDAFLVAWDGVQWRDVYRISAGHVTSIGRASTNRLVLRDESCSRNHCEVFHRDGDWVLRDLGSRNGTQVDGVEASGELVLGSGQVIALGECRLGFTTDMSDSFQPIELEGESSPTITPDSAPPSGDTGVAILDRRQRTRYRDGDGKSLRDRTAKELSRLYRLGLEMATAPGSVELSNVVLEGLSRETQADISAVLLFPDSLKSSKPSQLKVVSFYSENNLPYHRLSDNLSQIVLEEREAVLAHDVSDHTQLSVFESLGELDAISVICAPIRENERTLGLIHLYSTDPDEPLDSQHLEFTLAVADQAAVAFKNLSSKETLRTGIARLDSQNRNLQRQLEITTELIGDSDAMNELRQRIGLIAPTDATVLIRGESGVGKELIARSIHFNSKRTEGPLVCMNCAALSESLLESELFGHEKGAFTGATDRKIGRFEQANNGTLFLDEVGEMSPAIQAKFLRVLEGHPFERLGGRKQIEVDVRVVAATNRDLEAAVEEGDFRKDLYFRLHVAEIHAKPLREHPEDIEVLANHFLARFVESTGRPIRGFTADAMDTLMAYEWPGNIRELQNTIERTVIMCLNEVVRKPDVQLSALAANFSSTASAPVSSPAEYREVSIAELERDHILKTLEETEWNKSRASQILGIERSTLDRKLKRYRVSRPS